MEKFIANSSYSEIYILILWDFSIETVKGTRCLTSDVNRGYLSQKVSAV